MNSKYKDKLVGVYAPGNYDHTSVLDQTQEFSKWFWANHEDMEYISAKLGINAKKLNRILTLEQLPDEELLRKMGELCEKQRFLLPVILMMELMKKSTNGSRKTIVNCWMSELLMIKIRCTAS